LQNASHFSMETRELRVASSHGPAVFFVSS
jgi:hypothetical protein